MNRHSGSVLEIDAAAAHAAQQEGSRLLDLRDHRERLLGFPPDAEMVIWDPEAVQDFTAAIQPLADGPPLLVMCARGVRSAAAVRALADRGIAALSVTGGFEAWRAAALPFAYPHELEPRAAERYARHLTLDTVGPEGQQRLLNARVLLVGAGGLGSPAALYLAAAGVGHLGIADDDRVERSNLQRQILHEDAGVGESKVASAASRLGRLNPDIRVSAMPCRVDAGNLSEMLSEWDLVIDGADNFPTRYALNDACYHRGIPLIYGAVERFMGQVSVFHPNSDAGNSGQRAPCYRCLFPTAPVDAPNCAEAGVLGVLPGVIGTLQAVEAIKWILGIGEPLIGRLLIYDALAPAFRLIRVPADPNCELCSFS